MAQNLTQHECLRSTPFCPYDPGGKVKARSKLLNVLTINIFLFGFWNLVYIPSKVSFIFQNPQAFTNLVNEDNPPLIHRGH